MTRGYSYTAYKAVNKKTITDYPSVLTFEKLIPVLGGDHRPYILDLHTSPSIDYRL
jgi:hypothetical protein